MISSAGFASKSSKDFKEEFNLLGDGFADWTIGIFIENRT